MCLIFYLWRVFELWIFIRGVSQYYCPRSEVVVETKLKPSRWKLVVWLTVRGLLCTRFLFLFFIFLSLCVLHFNYFFNFFKKKWYWLEVKMIYDLLWNTSLLCVISFLGPIKTEMFFILGVMCILLSPCFYKILHY